MKTLSVVLTSVLLAGFAAAEVVTYPAPEGESLSPDYQVTAEGQAVDVYTARVLDPPFAEKQWDFGGPYSFANLDSDGPVELRIKSPRSLGNVVIRPASTDVKSTLVDDHTLVLTLPGPRKLSIEPDGKRGPLLLFVNPLEAEAPKADAPNVIYFGPGIHTPGKIEVGSDQTLYLAGGAVVKGGVLAAGDNITICGRGILDGSDWPWRQGPTPTVVSIRGNNITVSGITIRGASHWTIVPKNSRNVTVRNVKLCNSRVQNDDGINPCNSQDVLITDCFIRSDDDCVAMKGLDFSAENPNVERVTVENSILWCDRARIFLLGHESRAEFMRDIRLRNLDIIHFTMTPFLFEPGEEMRLENVTIEDVRIHGEGQNELIRLRPVVNQYMRNQVPGHVRQIEFRNVQLEGSPGPYRVQLMGADAEHRIEDVAFEIVSICGDPLTRQSSSLSVGEHVGDVRFENSGAAASPTCEEFDAEGFVSIFDGKSLDGWHVSAKSGHSRKSGNTSGGHWAVEDGAIVGRQEPLGNGGFVVTDAQYSEFELVLEMNNDFGPDSGIFMRSTEDGKTYQAHVDYHRGGTLMGLYGEGLGGKPRYRSFAFGDTPDQIQLSPELTPVPFPFTPEQWAKFWKHGQWNELRVRITGDEKPTITTWINGVRIMHWTETEARLPLAGGIGLQIHGGGDPGDYDGKYVRYRNLRVKRLD